jgi:hypothetical protein
MTLGGTISSVMIRIRGDGSNAVKALDDVADEAKKTEKALDEAGSAGDGMGKAMAGAAVAAAGMAAAVAAVASSVAAFAETNENAANTLAGLGARATDMQVAVGGAIFASDGFQEALGRVAQVMAFVSDNADTIAAVVSGTLNFAIDAAIVVVDSFAGGWAILQTGLVLGEATIDSLATGVVNMSSRVTIATNAIVDFGLAFAQGFNSVMDDGISLAMEFVTALGPIAEIAGIDLSGAVEGLGGYRDQIRANTEALQAMRTNLDASSAAQRDLIEANNEALGQRQSERVDELVTIYNDLDETLQATGNSQAFAVEGLAEYGRTATATAGAVEVLVEQLDKQAFAMARIEEARKAAVAEQVANAAGKDAAGMAALEAERLAGEQAKYAATEQLMADHLARMQLLEDERKAQTQARLDIQQSYADAELSMLQATGDALVNAAIEGGMAGAKAEAKTLSRSLFNQAKYQGLIGAFNLVPPPFNPFGNPAIGKLQIGLAAKAAAGAAALGVLGGGGGGGGGGQGLAGAGAGTIPAPTVPAINNNSNMTINNVFGIVGDQRQSARLVADSLGFARQKGMI